MRAVIDVSDLPRLHSGRDSTLWWGAAGLVVIVAMIAASFIASYFYLRLYNTQWPPPGTTAPALGLATFELLLLLGACAALRWAERTLAQGRRHWLRGVGIGLMLAIIVLAWRLAQFTTMEFGWDMHVYGSIVWATLGFHALLVLTAVLWMAAIGILALRGFPLRAHRYLLAAAALYWYFVGLVWAPLYLVLYWAPRWL